MQKFIPFAKLSKKTQQEINKSHRKSWGNIDQTSRKFQSVQPQKTQAWKDDFPAPELFYCCFSFKTKFIYIVD